MTRKRLTREESRELTRQRLIDAAASVIPGKGYLATSVEDIAAEAGFSRGAFYSNFSSKDELFIALLRQNAEEKHDAMQAIFEAGGDVAALREKLRNFYATVCRKQQEFILWTEAKIHAAREPTFRARLNELEREIRSQITDAVAQYCAAAGMEPPAPPGHLAFGFMALTDGMAFAQLLDPEIVNREISEAVLTLFFDAVVRHGNG